jgi:hypothetical protein
MQVYERNCQKFRMKRCCPSEKFAAEAGESPAVHFRDIGRRRGRPVRNAGGLASIEMNGFIQLLSC